MGEDGAVELAVDYLGVPQSVAQAQVRDCRGAYYKLEWLYSLFVDHRAASRWAYATRAYLLMLVGSTIFADKTFTLVEARYLQLFIDLDACGSYCWGAAALVTLYRYLGDASMFCCKQLGGYPTLLQVSNLFNLFYLIIVFISYCLLITFVLFCLIIVLDS